MTREQHLARLRPYVERARLFSGWDPSDLRVRTLDPGPPWDYAALVRRHGPGATSVLDMGTGGGELLADVRRALPRFAVATEPWAVNAPLARRRLAPLGVEVVRSRSQPLPFRDAAFDLVLNRHEELDPADVARVVRRGGWVVTQQVGAHDLQELRRHVPRMTDWGDLRRAYVEGFASAGLRVRTSAHHDRRVAYETLGDVVYLLCIAPWTIPDFDVERDLDALLALERDVSTSDGLVLTECRFLVVAEKPGPTPPRSRGRGTAGTAP